jgi:hypothetical protein
MVDPGQVERPAAESAGLVVKDLSADERERSASPDGGVSSTASKTGRRSRGASVPAMSSSTSTTARLRHAALRRAARRTRGRAIRRRVGAARRRAHVLPDPHSAE